MASCMASSLFLKRLALVLALPTMVTTASSSHAPGCHCAIISFGNSLTNTGNLLCLSCSDDCPTEAGFHPYGETYFRRPTSRFSDGRLVVNFVAGRLGLPYVAPYYGDDGGWSVEDFGKGVNFTVGGATALDVSFIEGRGMGNNFPNESQRVQLGLFKELLPSLCGTTSSKLSAVSHLNVSVEYILNLSLVCELKTTFKIGSGALKMAGHVGFHIELSI